MLNDLPRVFRTPDSNIMPVDSAVHMEGRLITEDYPVPKIIFQEFQHVYTEDSAKLFVIFSECLHKCQLVSLEFQMLLKNIPDC